MRVSVLIPIYNGVCLPLVRSLAAQRGLSRTEAWEILVADDGSTLREAILANREINDIPHCRYIERPENAGRAAIRNFLARSARYERLLFIDGDMGVSDPRYIDRYLDTESAVVCGGYRLVGQHPNNLRYLYEARHEAQSTAELRQRHPYHDFHISNCCIARAVALRYPLDEHYSGYGYEDVAYGRTLGEAGVGVTHICNPTDFHSFESNERFLRKTEESLRTLYAHRHELRGYSRLIALAGRLRRWRADKLLLCAYRRAGGAWRQRLATRPSAAWFSLYRLCYFLSLSTPSHSRTR